MTNEIKVILNYLDMYKNMDEGLLKSKDKKLLLDYITNLQEKNEFLKLNNPEMNIEHFNVIKENKRKINNLRAENKRLNNIINKLEKSAKEIVRVGKNKGYQYVENLNELKTEEEIYDFIEFYYGLYLLEQLDKLKELKDNK